MWLILAAERDRSAEWVYRGLSRRGMGPIHYLYPEELLRGARIAHHLSSTEASFSIRMADGRRLHSAAIRGVLNRLECAVDGSWWGAREDGHFTASEKLQSVVFSCLSCLEVPVLPGPHFGEHQPGRRTKQQWAELARRAGLPVAARASSAAPSCSGLVLFDRFFSKSVPEQFEPACIRLAALAGTPLMGVEFEKNTSGVVFSGICLCPDLRAGGAPFLNSLALIFQQVAKRSAGSGGGGAP
ncbi:MAG: hypothetical protein IT168_13085 [Bryobacterales bacterium]|nr:hypothetical protein [Bryobacterales bacterium]